ncbi:hypothetical protein LF927_02385 [Pectobacterium polaris]|nr:hypothetical protein [Pectobacterium polaris]MCA6958685.1 hypothetical protein [Pectobacterium polaris]
MHAILTPGSALQRQYWRGFSTSMQLHEMRYIKRAGVAGIALRAIGIADTKRTKIIMGDYCSSKY